MSKIVKLSADEMVGAAYVDELLAQGMAFIRVTTSRSLRTDSELELKATGFRSLIGSGGNLRMGTILIADLPKLEALDLVQKIEQYENK